MKTTLIAIHDSQVLAWAGIMILELMGGSARADPLPQTNQEEPQTYRLSIVGHDDKPLPGLDLLLGGPSEQHKIKTGPKGQCEIAASNHSADPIPIRIMSPGWILVNLRDDRRVEAIALPRNPAVEIRLRAERARTLSGRLVNQEGASVAGAEISVIVAMRYAQSYMRAVDYLPDGSCGHLKSPFKSDLQGRFAIEVPDIAGAYAIQARRGPQLRSEAIFLDSWSKNPSLPLVIKLFRTGRIEGQIRFESGKRPRFLTLLLNKKYRPLPPLASDDIEEATSIQLDRRDRFAAKNLLPGRYRLDVSQESHGNPPGIIAQVDIHVLSGQTTVSNLVLTQGKPQKWDIQGVVLDETGRGIEGVTVTATLVERPSAKPAVIEPGSGLRYRVLSDEQGRFVIPATKDDRWILRTGWTKPDMNAFLGLRPAQLPVTAGQRGVQLRTCCQLAGVLHGQILYGKTVRWIEPIHLSYILRGQGIERRFSSDGDQERFSLRHIPPGQYEIQLCSNGYEPMIQKLMIHAGGATYAQFRPKIPKVIRGRILDAQGLPISGVAVWVKRTSHFRDVLDHKAAGAISAHNGRFSLAVDGPWQSYLLVQKQGYAFQRFHVRIRDRTKEHELTLYKEATLILRELPVHGTVFGELFDKSDSYSLSLTHLDRAGAPDREIVSSASYSSERAELRFDRIPAGDYLIEIYAWRRAGRSGDGILTVERRVHVDARGTTTIDWRKLSK